MARRKRKLRRHPASPYALRLIVMAKSPHYGLVKRRLAAGIGEGGALRFYRSCLRHTLLRLAASPRWRTVLAISPDCDLHAPFWPKGIARVPQGRGNLGARMLQLIKSQRPGPVIIIGSDIPGIRTSDVAHAFRLLRGADAVFGPAKDGGYWLVGFKHASRKPSPFANVRWSRPHTLKDTLANLRGKRVAFAATLSDVDRKADFRHLGASAARLITPPGAA